MHDHFVKYSCVQKERLCIYFGRNCGPDRSEKWFTQNDLSLKNILIRFFIVHDHFVKCSCVQKERLCIYFGRNCGPI